MASDKVNSTTLVVSSSNSETPKITVRFLFLTSTPIMIILHYFFQSNLKGISLKTRIQIQQQGMVVSVLYFLVSLIFAVLGVTLAYAESRQFLLRVVPDPLDKPLGAAVNPGGWAPDLFFLNGGTWGLYEWPKNIWVTWVK